MLPIAASTPITKYNRATTRPPMNWPLDPAPAIRSRNKVESILVAPAPPSRYNRNSRWRSEVLDVEKARRAPFRLDIMPVRVFRIDVRVEAPRLKREAGGARVV